MTALYLVPNNGNKKCERNKTISISISISCSCVERFQLLVCRVVSVVRMSSARASCVFSRSCVERFSFVKFVLGSGSWRS